MAASGRQFRRSPVNVLTSTTVRVRRRFAAALVIAGAIVLLGGAVGTMAASAAQPPVGLGTAASFAVLAGSTVTNTGPSTISGNLGLSPGTAVTGFPPGKVIDGKIHAADAVALQAEADLTTAYNDSGGSHAGDGGARRHRWYETGGRRLQGFVRSRSDRHGYPERAEQSQRRVHLPSWVHTDHRVEQHREPAQRRPSLQRVLAGR